MIHELSDIQILSLMEKAGETAVSKFCMRQGITKSQFSQREAFKQFGETNVRRWKRDGKVNPHKKGGIIYYQVIELEAMRNLNELYEKHFNHERNGHDTD